MTQENLDQHHRNIIELITHYMSGLLTIEEMQAAISKIDLTHVDGLIDPATGLRY
jgi:hypothetical protein